MALCLLLAASYGCGSVQIKDATFYGSLGPNGAVSFNLLSSGSSDLSLEQWAAKWDDLANAAGPMICERTSTLANLKQVIETLCSWNSSECTQQAQSQVDAFMSRVSAVERK